MKLLVTSKQKQPIKHLDTNYIQKPRKTIIIKIFIYLFFFSRNSQKHQEMKQNNNKQQTNETNSKNPPKALSKTSHRAPGASPNQHKTSFLTLPPHKMKASTAMPINMQNRERGEQKGKQTCIRGLLATRAGTIITRIPTSSVTGRKTIVTLE